jgi:hypothetical protein
MMTGRGPTHPPPALAPALPDLRRIRSFFTPRTSGFRLSKWNGSALLTPFEDLAGGVREMIVVTKIFAFSGSDA